ncbi:MAG: pyrroline-5-carboxylate reductase [Planctomycetes bacterium]|nr:pyrroline-5-carboxylate reductase [Planctomycetota bacterium]
MSGAAGGDAIGFIGAGKMAEALAGSLIRGGIPASRLVASDVAPERREALARLGIRVTPDNREVAGAAGLLVLAVKPQAMREVLEGIAGATRPGAIVLSIAAGIPAAFIEERLGALPVVRAMPNTPVLVGAGAVAIATGRHATEADLDRAEAVFRESALVVRVDESAIDAVTAVSGSGPAYFFLLVEAAVEAGVAEGLPRETALALARQTLFGAGKLLLESGREPADLRKAVTSPGGTTEAALRRMDERGVFAALVDAIRRAAERSRELRPA